MTTLPEGTREALALRDKILMNMDVGAAQKFIMHHGGDVPNRPISWIKILHLARIEITSIPEHYRMESQIWLARNDPRRISDYPPTALYPRVAADLIFPRNLFVDYMKETRGESQDRPGEAS